MRIRILIFIFLFILGCKKNNLDNIEIIDITKGIKAENEKFYLSEIATKIDYVFLETKEECLMNNIDKLMIDDNQVFIFNKKQFFIFYTDGKYKTRVGDYGKGPGEYLRIMDFTINTEADEIYIYDSAQQKVIIFDYEGHYVSEFSIEGYPTCITCVKNKYLYLSYVRPDFMKNDNFGVSVYTLDGNLIKKEFNRTEEVFDPSDPSTSLTRLNYYFDTLTYWEINLDVIYKITDNDHFIPRYRITYSSNTEDKDMNEIERKIFRYSYFIETQRYLFFLKGVYNGEIKHLMYDKQNKTCYSPFYESESLKFSLNSAFTNDIDGGYPFLPFDVLGDGRLYSIVNLYEYKFQRSLERRNFGTNEMKGPVKEKTVTAKLIDNPAIMIVTLK